MVQKLQYPQYDVFNALRMRRRENGLAVMPTAGPSPQPAQSVVLHGGIEYDVIAYVASKRGEPPTVPGPATTNPNRIFLKGWQSGLFAVPDASGATRYTLQGYLIFGILNPEGLKSDFMLGCLPFPGVDPNEYVPGTYLSYTLLNQNVVSSLNGQSSPSLPMIVRTISNQG